MIRIAICDDEKYYCEHIKKEIIKCMIVYNMVYKIDTFSSGKDLAALGIEISRYHIVFLDINMDDMDGIETAQNIRKYSMNIFIVFITAFFSYASEGYKVDAIRYLLKNKENFDKSMAECIKAILEKMNYKIEKKRFHFIENKKSVAVYTILYIESKLHKLAFWIMDQDLAVYHLYGKLDDMEALLIQHGFIRIHKSFLVNIKQIRKISCYKALLSNGLELPISKSQYKLVKEFFIEWNGEI